jgi:hypothetical protein
LRLGFSAEQTKLRYAVGPAIEEMKPGRIIVAGLFCLILCASPAFAASAQSSQGSGVDSQHLSLSLSGLITNAGTQHYELDGGHLIGGSVNGQPVSPGKILFNLDATVHGLSVSGGGSLQLSHGFYARITIDDAVPAAIFPLSPTGANCDPTSEPCNSEIPVLFTGTASVQTGEGDAVQVPIGIESAYWDPLGGPIVITSLPSGAAFSFVVTYSTATITWIGVQLQGGFAGKLGSESVSGLYSQMTYSQENLLKGTEFDIGSIVFAQASDPKLDGHGLFFGHTTFTNAVPPGEDCTMPPFSFPLPEGTCLATGATSNGEFLMAGGEGTFILGYYHTTWSVPSLFTQTTVMASVF